jgi:excinuclease ABC subunit C
VKRRIRDSVLRLGGDLGLSPLPVRIEGFDISHHRGEEPVASMVVFENGEPKKSDYRRFKIKTVAGGDDYRSMEEAITRRFTHTDPEFGPLPDWVLIDGGPIQLRFALDAIQQVAKVHDEPRRSRIKNQRVLSLAKREEEIFLPDSEFPIRLPERHPGLQLLRQVRDEAHRFAIALHRKRKAVIRQTSALASVPGIGPARVEKLLIAFGSMEEIAKLRPEEVARIPGISPELAETVIRICGAETRKEST